MLSDKEKSIACGLVILLYETESHEGCHDYSGHEAFTIERRTVIKLPDLYDEQSKGYQLFTTKIGDSWYIGIHEIYFDDSGEVKATLQYSPNDRYCSFRQLYAKIDALIEDEDWAS